MSIAIAGCNCGQPCSLVGSPPECPVHSGRRALGAKPAIELWEQQYRQDQVRASMAQAKSEYIIVPAHDYTVDTQAHYAYGAVEADETKKRLEAETGRVWKVFSR